MVLSAPVIALGATLGTATSILALCGLTCLCKCKRSGKGSSDKEQDLDTENAKPSVLQTVQQVRHYWFHWVILLWMQRLEICKCSAMLSSMCEYMIYSSPLCCLQGFRVQLDFQTGRRREGGRRELRWPGRLARQSSAFVLPGRDGKTKSG